MKKLIFSFLFLIIVLNISAQNADDILGKWINASGKAHIEIFKSQGKYFGKIVWLREPNEKDGKAKLDKKNPDDQLKLKPILGLQILRNFSFDKDEWTGGRIYDPENGKDYKCYMRLKEHNSLSVRGYIGISLIGRTEVWTRTN